MAAPHSSSASRLLEDLGENLEACDSWGRSVTVLLALSGRRELCRRAIELGAPVNPELRPAQTEVALLAATPRSG